VAEGRGLGRLAAVLPLIVCWSAGLSWAADSYEPDDAWHVASPILTDGTPQTHEIDPATDVDYVWFEAGGPAQCVIETAPTPTDDVQDTVITLFDSDGTTVLAEDDDGGEGLYSKITYTLAGAGTYYARTRSYGASHTGGYRLSVRLAESAVVHGTVTGGGAPVEGAAIWVRPGTGAYDRPTAVALTDAQGRYAAEVAAGSYLVSAHLAGYVASPAQRQVQLPCCSRADFELSTAPPPAADGVETCRAVLVGIADYAGTHSDLSYCDEDALDFGAALAGGANWLPGNIQVILNRKATADAIWAGLQRMATLADADDLCLFFFSGHGSRGPDEPPYDEGGGQDEYLCETDGEHDIRDDELAKWIQDLPTQKVMVVLCACYSGGFIKAAAVAPKGLGSADPVGAQDDFADDLRRAMMRRRQMSPLDLDDNGYGVVITAAEDFETCQEADELQHDVLVYYLLQGMEGPADADGDSLIGAEELHAWAGPRATKFNARQHAQLYDAAPEVEFEFLNRGAAPPQTVTITRGPAGTPSLVESGGTVACTVTAADSLGGALTYAWSATAGGFDEPLSASPTWMAPQNQSADDLHVTIAVTVCSAGKPSVCAQGSFLATVLPAQQGRVTITDGPSCTPAIVVPGETARCAVRAEDGPGAGLQYRWRALDPAGASVGGFSDPSAASPTWTAPDNRDGAVVEYTLVVTVGSSADPDSHDTGSCTARVPPILAYSFPAGVRMISLPGTPVGSLADILGLASVAAWDAGCQHYGYLDAAAVVPQAGEGWWARFHVHRDAQVATSPWDQDTFAWQLARGWNLIGVPWTGSVWVGGLSCEPEGAAAPLAWNYWDGGYELVAPLDAAAMKGGRALLGEGGWALRVAVTSASGRDEANFCGVSAAGDEADAPNPPAPLNGPDLRFISPDGARLALDFRRGDAAGQEWEIEVAAPAGEVTTVRCPDLSPLPGDLGVLLLDRDAGRTVSMRTTAGYGFVAGETPRRLLLRVVPAASTLCLSAVTAQQTAPRRAAITYALSAPAAVIVDLHNIAGRRVARIAASEAADAGVQSLSWDLRSDRGTAVPAGRYLVRVTARSEDGQQVNALAALSVAR